VHVTLDATTVTETILTQGEAVEVAEAILVAARGDPGGCPVSRLAHWALSPLDLQAHLLLAEGCHPKGVLTARCGHLLPLRAMRFAEFSAQKCTDCHLMSLSEAILALRCENPVRKGVSR